MFAIINDTSVVKRKLLNNLSSSLRQLPSSMSIGHESKLTKTTPKSPLRKNYSKNTLENNFSKFE